MASVGVARLCLQRSLEQAAEAGPCRRTLPVHDGRRGGSTVLIATRCLDLEATLRYITVIVFGITAQFGLVTHHLLQLQLNILVASHTYMIVCVVVGHARVDLAQDHLHEAYVDVTGVDLVRQERAEVEAEAIEEHVLLLEIAVIEYEHARGQVSLLA